MGWGGYVGDGGARMKLTMTHPDLFAAIGRALMEAGYRIEADGHAFEPLPVEEWPGIVRELARKAARTDDLEAEAAEAEAEVRDEQAIWDAYRADPRHQPILQAAGLDGPNDMDAALDSDFEVVPAGDDPEEEPPILLGDHVLHTITAFAAGQRP